MENITFAQFMAISGAGLTAGLSIGLLHRFWVYCYGMLFKTARAGIKID